MLRDRSDTWTFDSGFMVLNRDPGEQDIMDDIEQKALTYVLAKEIKKLHHQRNVYLGVLQQLKNDGCQGVDALVKNALQSPDIQAMTDHAFSFLDQWLPPIPEVDLEKARRLWLEQWKPDGQEPN